MTFKSGMNRLDNLSLKRLMAFSSPRGESYAILLRGKGDRKKIDQNVEMKSIL
jgi:hypothetical protein